MPDPALSALGTTVSKSSRIRAPRGLVFRYRGQAFKQVIVVTADEGDGAGLVLTQQIALSVCIIR